MMAYYKGHQPGNIPGNLPEPYYWWEGIFSTSINPSSIQTY